MSKESIEKELIKCRKEHLETLDSYRVLMGEYINLQKKYQSHSNNKKTIGL